MFYFFLLRPGLFCIRPAGRRCHRGSVVVAGGSKVRGRLAAATDPVPGTVRRRPVPGPKLPVRLRVRQPVRQVGVRTQSRFFRRPVVLQ